MKKLMVIVLATYAFVFSQGFREVAAFQGFTPLEDLAGTYAATAQGSLFLCFKGTPPPLPAKCGSEGSVGFPFSVLQVGSAIYDTDGNACATVTNTSVHLPVDASPPFVVEVHSVAKVTSYDPTTGTGDASFTNYVGGQCTGGPFGGRGALFDSTGATVAGTGTFHFTASDDGKRIDFVVTSSTNAVGSIGGFSLSGTQLRQ
ncbi:MAG TPA: hypothetical protein VGX03_20245 [Candidatus Binatia bacterium]|jgi:hypothetical protein|nr:hypothetical protein [Candidatus Binatia bacterium]